MRGRKRTHRSGRVSCTVAGFLALLTEEIAQPGATSSAQCTSQPGFFPSESNPDLMLKCAHTEACPGGSVCGAGYRYVSLVVPVDVCMILARARAVCSGRLCGECDSGKYYRVGEYCVKCPSNSWWRILIACIILILAVVLAMVVGHKFTKYRQAQQHFALSAHIGMVSIVVSYLQIAAIFEQLEVDWPITLRRTFRLFSALNLNIDLIASVCHLVWNH